MRQIKFRAWYKNNWEFTAPQKLEYLTFDELCDSGSSDNSEFEWMQYTGLKDKNGKEIYEGDIVKSFSNINKISDPHLTDREPEYKHKAVKFKDGAFILYDGEYDFLGVLGYNTATKSETLEVIGNIYENPELLKEV